MVSLISSMLILQMAVNGRCEDVRKQPPNANHQAGHDDDCNKSGNKGTHGVSPVEWVGWLSSFDHRSVISANLYRPGNQAPHRNYLLHFGQGKCFASRTVLKQRHPVSWPHFLHRSSTIAPVASSVQHPVALMTCIRTRGFAR